MVDTSKAAASLRAQKGCDIVVAPYRGYLRATSRLLGLAVNSSTYPKSRLLVMAIGFCSCSS